MSKAMRTNGAKNTSVGKGKGKSFSGRVGKMGGGGNMKRKRVAAQGDDEGGSDTGVTTLTTVQHHW